MRERRKKATERERIAPVESANDIMCPSSERVKREMVLSAHCTPHTSCK